MAAREFAIALVNGYQRWLRPMRASGAPTCRFEPSCSEYAVQALREWGLARGLLLSARRLARCHPWGGIGMDPVPSRPVRSSADAAATATRRPSAA